MSASLVGSEMCIRDSTTMGRSRRPGGSGGPGPRMRDPLTRAPLLPASAAVSYTHLPLPTICSV
eukprot:10948732-Alexandrium_andersonii.AAC.1